MDLFDYVYYKACDFYSNYGGSSPKFSGFVVVAMMQYFNLYAIYLLICILLHKKFNEGIITDLIIGILLLIFNGVRYNKKNYDLLKQKWKDEDVRIKLKRRRLVTAYVIISTIICIGLTIYLGSKKW